MKILKSKCKKRIAILWLLFTGFITAIVLIQTITGHYGNQIEEVWSWILTTLMPSVSLITTVIIYNSQQDKDEKVLIDRFYFRVTFWISVVYLFTVLSIILLLPFITLKPDITLDKLKNSNLWLAPFQGILIAVLGIFFVKTENHSKKYN